MTLKILHTADWHIGQVFYDFDRSFEHQKFLNWLLGTLKTEEIDVLLMAGDVFDVSNPSATSVRLFYQFLMEAVRVRPTLQIVIIAGNHDSPTRLEAPIPLLENTNIHIVGKINKTEAKEIDYQSLIIPLKSASGEVAAWCIAIPYLHLGEYPSISDAENPYSAGVAALYQAAYQRALAKKEEGQTILAMGHLHTLKAELSSGDKSERQTVGGLDHVPVTIFDEKIIYAALGHIHKAQKVGGRENVRYAGSPLPMSFSEKNYKHQVVTFEIKNEKIENFRCLEIPVVVQLLHIDLTLEELNTPGNKLTQLVVNQEDKKLFPYLEVRVAVDAPEPALRHKVETALLGKNVRLVSVKSQSPKRPDHENNTSQKQEELENLKPIDIFIKYYQKKYSSEISADLLEIFRQVEQEVLAESM